jgi:hypothetical protein
MAKARRSDLGRDSILQVSAAAPLCRGISQIGKSIFRLTCSAFWLAPQNRLYGESVVGFRGFTFYFRPSLNFLAKAFDSLPGFGSSPPA